MLHESFNEETKFQQVINQTQRAQFENALYSDANQLADYKLQNKKSLLQAHNLLKLKSNDDKDQEIARRRLLRNFTLASKDELEARREMYRPINLKDKIKPEKDPEQVKTFDDAAFRAIVRNVMANMHGKERRLT